MPGTAHLSAVLGMRPQAPRVVLMARKKRLPRGSARQVCTKESTMTQPAVKKPFQRSRRRWTAVFIGCLAVEGHAGEIFGTISAQNAPVANELVSITCESGADDSKRTDQFGSYRLFVRAEGMCRLRVRNLEGVVRSYGSAQRYNFDISAPNGTPRLERR
jgi:hypothetical protein